MIGAWGCPANACDGVTEPVSTAWRRCPECGCDWATGRWDAEGCLVNPRKTPPPSIVNRPTHPTPPNGGHFHNGVHPSESSVDTLILPKGRRFRAVEDVTDGDGWPLLSCGHRAPAINVGFLPYPPPVGLVFHCAECEES